MPDLKYLNKGEIMEIKLNKIKIQDEELEFIVKIKADLLEMTGDWQRRDRLGERVRDKIVNHLADYILQEHSDEILNEVDIKSIIKGIQLKAVYKLTDPSH